MREQISSIRYPFAVDSGMGRLAQEADYEAHIRQMMMQILLTNPGERINRPDFGCGIKRMVFAPNSDVSANLLQVTILQAIEKWLGDLIAVDSVKAEADNEVLKVNIAYTLKSIQQRRFLNVEVTL